MLYGMKMTFLFSLNAFGGKLECFVNVPNHAPRVPLGILAILSQARIVNVMIWGYVVLAPESFKRVDNIFVVGANYPWFLYGVTFG